MTLYRDVSRTRRVPRAAQSRRVPLININVIVIYAQFVHFGITYVRSAYTRGMAIRLTLLH